MEDIPEALGMSTVMGRIHRYQEILAGYERSQSCQVFENLL